jgi:hypothetical protein
MNKFTTYFGQLITETELNEILGELVGGIERFVQDFGFFGVAAGATIVQHTPPNLTVDVTGPAIVYDANAQRMEWGTSQVVSCSTDENGAAVTVGSGNEKWLSLFAKFVGTPSDPRTDDRGDTVFFRTVAGFQIRVAQGAEAPIGFASRVALRGDQVLLGDVRLVNGQTTITASDISAARAQTIFTLPGAPLSIKAKALKDVLQAMVDQINTFSGAIGAIGATSIAVGAIGGSPVSLPAQSVAADFASLLSALNARAATVDLIHGVSGDIELVTPISRSRTINIYKGYTTHAPTGDKLGWRIDDAEPCLISEADFARVTVPIELPVGATLTRVRALVGKGSKPGSTAITMKVVKDQPINFTFVASPPAPTRSVLGTATFGTAGDTGLLNVDLSEPIASNARHSVIIEASDNTSIDVDRFYGIQLVWTDPTFAGR